MYVKDNFFYIVRLRNSCFAPLRRGLRAFGCKQTTCESISAKCFISLTFFFYCGILFFLRISGLFTIKLERGVSGREGGGGEDNQNFSQTLDAFTFPKLSAVLPITPSSSPLSLSLCLSPPPPNTINTANEGRFRLNVDSPYGERAQSTVRVIDAALCPRRDLIKTWRGRNLIRVRQT